MPKTHPALPSFLVHSQPSYPIDKAKRLQSLYGEAALYYFSHFSQKDKVNAQLFILHQHLNKIFRGNPIYRGFTEKASDIDNIIRLSPYSKHSAEFVKKSEDPKSILEDLYVLLIDARIDLRTTIEPIKTVMKKNVELSQDSTNFSHNLAQRTKILKEILIDKLVLQLNRYQQSNHAFRTDADLYSSLSRLYYGEPVYYKDIVPRSTQFKQQIPKTKVNLNLIKSRELKWQLLVLLNHLEVLLEQNSLYQIDNSSWFAFRRFFIREKYAPEVLSHLVSSVKKKLEELVYFLAVTNFDVNKTRFVIKKIIESDYTFYTRGWLPSCCLRSEAAKAEYISQYIRKIDATIGLSVDSLVTVEGYLEKEMRPHEVTTFTSKASFQPYMRKRSSDKRKQPYPKKLTINPSNAFFKASTITSVNDEQKRVNAAPIAASGFNVARPLTHKWRQTALQPYEFEILHQVINNTIIYLKEYKRLEK